MGMRYLPLLLDLHGCPVTLIGAGTVALRKARLLTAAGARLTVLAPAACTELAGWAEAGRLTWPVCWSGPKSRSATSEIVVASCILLGLITR